MATRRITGTVHTIQDLPWSNARIRFALLSPSFTADTQYPISTQEVKTDSLGRLVNESGQLGIDLWCNGTGLTATAYRCTMPDGQEFIFTLDAGSALTFTQIRVLGTPVNQSNSSLLAYISAQVAASGTGGGSGAERIYTVVPTVSQTVFILPLLPIAPSLTKLFINGVRYAYLEDYTLSGYVLTWLNFNLSPSHRLDFYY